MTKPSIQEIDEHFKSIGVTESGLAEKFYWYYESTGWMIGKNKKMVSWQAACQTWKRNLRTTNKQAVKF
jgi:hypothetical protein